MIILIFLICLLIASVIFAGAFYLAKKFIALQTHNATLTENYKLAVAHIEKLEESNVGLQQELGYMRAEAEIKGDRQPRTSSFNPKDMLNSSERARE